MEKKKKQQEESKKRDAFKRFSQIGVAAILAVRLIPTFTDITAQQVPSNVENDSVKEQNLALVDMPTDKATAEDLFAYNNSCYSDYSNYGNYSNYTNYYNYTNYSNYNDYYNYSNYSNCD